MSRRVKFSKMHGAGNDFVVVDELSGPVRSWPVERIAALADRHCGVGFDQLLILRPGKGVAACYDIYNQDGSAARQCGNGARCVARYLQIRHGFEPPFDLLSPSGVVAVQNGVSGPSVALSPPDFRAERVPMVGQGDGPLARLSVLGETIELVALSMGNPHAVLIDDGRADFPALARAVQAHPAFPDQVNVSWVKVLDTGRLRLRVVERGVGETRACGSGACAAMVAMHWRGLVDQHVAVELPGGTLNVSWAGAGHPVWLSGPAELVYDGELL